MTTPDADTQRWVLRKATYARAFSLHEDGMSDDFIAEQLHVSPDTARQYIAAGRPAPTNAPSSTDAARPCMVCGRPWDEHLVREWRMGCTAPRRE